MIYKFKNLPTAHVGEDIILPPGNEPECLFEWNQVVDWYEFAGTFSVMEVDTAREDNILPYSWRGGKFAPGTIHRPVPRRL